MGAAPRLDVAALGARSHQLRLPQAARPSLRAAPHPRSVAARVKFRPAERWRRSTRNARACAGGAERLLELAAGGGAQGPIPPISAMRTKTLVPSRLTARSGSKLCNMPHPALFKTMTIGSQPYRAQCPSSNPVMPNAPSPTSMMGRRPLAACKPIRRHGKTHRRVIPWRNAVRVIDVQRREQTITHVDGQGKRPWVAIRRLMACAMEAGRIGAAGSISNCGGNGLPERASAFAVATLSSNACTTAESGKSRYT